MLFGKTRPGTISGISLKSPTITVLPTNRMLSQVEVIPPIRNLERPTSIGYLYSKFGDTIIYFSDAASFSIKKRKFNETKAEPKILIDKGQLIMVEVFQFFYCKFLNYQKSNSHLNSHKD